MQYAMKLRDERPRLRTAGLVHACLCIALASASTGCAFEASGTGEARTRRSGAFGPFGEVPSARETDEAAQIAADRLRSLAQPSSNGEAGSTAAQGPDREPETAMPAAGANAISAGEAGAAAGSAGAGLPVLTTDEGRVVTAADGGPRAIDESDAGDDSDAGSAPLAGGHASPPMAAGASGAGGGTATRGDVGVSGTGAAGSAGSGRGGRAGASGSGGARGMAGRGEDRDESSDTDESSDEGGRENGN